MGSLRTAPTIAPDAPSLPYDVVANVVDADHPVRVLDYVPRRATARTPLVWLHGGGWVTGGLDAGESVVVARALASRGRRVRTVDYRLVPMLGLASPRLAPSPHRYPAALDDVVHACAHLAGGGAIAIGGASAGAAVAASAALRLAAEGAAPRAMVLAYGALHAALPPRTAEGHLGMLGVATPQWAARWMYARFARNYTGPSAGAEHAFVRGADLARLPPTLLLDAQHDPLRASGEAFARELVDASTVAERHVVPGAWHGFLSRPGTPAFAGAIERIAAWLERLDA